MKCATYEKLRLLPRRRTVTLLYTSVTLRIGAGVWGDEVGLLWVMSLC